MSELLTFSNPKVQRLRRLIGRRSARYDEGRFVVEGAPLIRQALAAGWQIEGVYIDGPAPADLRAHPWFELAPNVIDRVASTETPMPELAVFEMRQPMLPADADFVVVADRLNDPGNCGTIVRSAEAAGAQAVVLTAGSVDPYNPKVIRASAGSLFRCPVVVGASVADVRAAGLRVVGTSSHRGTVYTQADLRSPVALLVGNEAHGVDGGADVDEWLTIPHAGPTESLNVAMATTLLVFEVARQRRGEYVRTDGR